MMRYAIKRLLLAVPTLLAMLTAVFILVRLVPQDGYLTYRSIRQILFR